MILNYKYFSNKHNKKINTRNKSNGSKFLSFLKKILKVVELNKKKKIN